MYKRQVIYPAIAPAVIVAITRGDSKDILGRTYEYCLSKFAEQEGKLAGEFYTCLLYTSRCV